MHKNNLFLLLAILSIFSTLILYLVFRDENGELNVNYIFGILLFCLLFFSSIYIIYSTVGLDFILSFLTTCGLFGGISSLGNIRGFKLYIVLFILPLLTLFIIRGLFRANTKFIIGFVIALFFVVTVWITSEFSMDQWA
jgi:hypothetical protein